MSLKFAVLGDPVDHSLSPPMHTAALDSVGLTGTYERRNCDEQEFGSLVEELRTGFWDGFNVTMPHKGLAHRTADGHTAVATLAQSVNTLKVEDDGVIGHSTDVVAFQRIFSASDFSGKPVLVLGSGGSAAAAVAAATLSGPAGIYLSSRNSDAARALADRFVEDQVALVDSGTPVAGAVVVNATPLGMKGESLPDHLLGTASGLIDLPYGPSPTPSASSLAAKSIPVIDGYRFLALQAAESFLWWTGQPVAVELMETAARNG